MYNKKSKIELKKNLKRESFNRITCSFYKYCFIDNPEDLRNKLFLDLIEQYILGRIYISKEGINAQISIPEHNVEDFKFENFVLNGYSPHPTIKAEMAV